MKVTTPTLIPSLLRPGWVSGNALVALVTAPGPNYGNRAAISYNYQPANASKHNNGFRPERMGHGVDHPSGR